MNARLVAVLVCLGATSAFAWGPVVEAGPVITLQQATSSGVSFNNLVGPRLLAGLEVGDRFNHEFAVEWSRVSGVGNTSLSSTPVSLQTLAGRYTFSVDFLKKEGFTPLLGVGFAAGTADVTAGDQAASRFYLAFHAVAGARYTFDNGLGLKVQLTVSTYGGFVGLQPSVAAAWRF
jgi:hypothetical protein